MDEEGNSAVFRIATGPDGRIAAASYRCTTCFTLVALCEHLAELVSGETAAAAGSWTAERLLAFHHEVPAARQTRAALAVSAMQSAVQNSLREVTV